MPDDALNHETLDGMRAYEPPPEGFDPHTAPQEVLRRYGLPRRPDPDREPGLAWLWKRALARPPTFIKAELAVDRIMSGRDPQRPRKPAVDGQNGFYWENTWAGLIRERNDDPGSDYAEPATCVFTSLRVPTVYDLTPGQTVAIGCWAGIDSDSDILQAGITAEVDPPGIFGGGGIKYGAWVEWWPADSYNLNNFPVSQGDEVLIQVTVEQPDLGNAFFHNLSTGLATSVAIPAPPGVTVSGGTAEWIVEVVTEFLPLFSTVNFDNCVAGTRHGVFFLEPAGFVTDMAGNPAPAQGFTQAVVVDRSTLLVGQRGTNWF